MGEGHCFAVQRFASEVPSLVNQRRIDYLAESISQWHERKKPGERHSAHRPLPIQLHTIYKMSIRSRCNRVNNGSRNAYDVHRKKRDTLRKPPFQTLEDEAA